MQLLSNNRSRITYILALIIGISFYFTGVSFHVFVVDMASNSIAYCYDGLIILLISAVLSYHQALMPMLVVRIGEKWYMRFQWIVGFLLMAIYLVAQFLTVGMLNTAVDNDSTRWAQILIITKTINMIVVWIILESTNFGVKRLVSFTASYMLVLTFHYGFVLGILHSL